MHGYYSAYPQPDGITKINVLLIIMNYMYCKNAKKLRRCYLIYSLYHVWKRSIDCLLSGICYFVACLYFTVVFLIQLY